MEPIPETLDGLPTICGFEDRIAATLAAARGRPVFLASSGVDFGRIRSAAAVALHMHLSLIHI